MVAGQCTNTTKHASILIHNEILQATHKWSASRLNLEIQVNTEQERTNQWVVWSANSKTPLARFLRELQTLDNNKNFRATPLNFHFFSYLEPLVKTP